MGNRRDLTEIFGYAPDDLSRQARMLWNLGACPFVNKACVKYNHDQSIVYGTCSVTSPYGNIVICPNRLYANDYESIRWVAKDAFGKKSRLYFFDEFIKKREELDNCVVALGKNSEKEVQLGNSLSMDWVLARIADQKLEEYAGIEVQSIDITGNYRDAWHAYNNLPQNPSQTSFPSSRHGLNWANVHKRLIPQLIRKGIVYSKSSLVQKGLYFIIPNIVYRKFEDITGSIPEQNEAKRNTITVCTYELGADVEHGRQRTLTPVRTVRFLLEEFAQRFIQGPNLPSGEQLDEAVMRTIGIRKK